MKTVATKQKQDQQLQEAVNMVNTWKNKFHFSFATLLFSILVSVVYNINPLFGNIPTIVLSIITLVFIQQSIRSYNYLKFHIVTYRAIKIMHKMIDDKF